MKYQEWYGSGVINRSRVDFSRCAENVTASGGWGSHQCSKKARYDWDEELGQFTTCKVHSDAEKTRRRAAREASYQARRLTEAVLASAAVGMVPIHRTCLKQAVCSPAGIGANPHVCERCVATIQKAQVG